MIDLASLLATDDDPSPAEADCGCTVAFDGDVLEIDADDCPVGGRLAESEACRATVVRALRQRDATTVRVTDAGLDVAYEGDAATLLSAAGRFAEAVAHHDERLARLAHRDPLAAAAEAAGRADDVAGLVTETGLGAAAEGVAEYPDALDPFVGPTVSRWRVTRRPPDGARLDAVRELATGATVRIYDRTGHETRWYHLYPPEAALDAAGAATVAAAYNHLAGGGAVAGATGDRAAPRAVRAVADDDVPVRLVSQVLRRHTTGHGLLEDFFADDELSDVYVTAPAGDTDVRVRLDGETLATNVRLTDEGVRALASRFRRESGRAFSRAEPTLDAAVTVGSRRVRVAGVTAPASDGPAFAFRAHDRTVWTLPALVANGTLTAAAAALLSLAVERGRALILAGPRGSGKTTALGALLWELPEPVRTVCIEDAPELPVAALQAAGRDVQGLRAGGEGEELSAVEALRTALRLGDGALVVGEVRGEEAGVLYEAMRVGANSEAVLGTIHGDGAADVYERVVSDLGVQPSAFGATDLVVSLEAAPTPDGTERRVAAIEEVTGVDPPQFDALFEQRDAGLEPTGRIDRGNSRLVASLTRPDESYATVSDRLEDRATWLSHLADTGRTGGQAVTEARARRETGESQPR
ncbi:ATPase, T2SS/T4P/T4SS family [Halobacteriales archaeon Cl-PHB]